MSEQHKALRTRFLKHFKRQAEAPYETGKPGEAAGELRENQAIKPRSRRSGKRGPLESKAAERSRRYGLGKHPL